MNYKINTTKQSDSAEYIVIEYDENIPFHADFKELLMINIEEMEEQGRVEWAVYCDGPDGEETRLALIQGNPGVSIEADIRKIAIREWRSARRAYNQYRQSERRDE